MNTPAGENVAIDTQQNIELRAQTFIRYLQDHFEDLQDEGKIPLSWDREAAGSTDSGYDIEAQALVYTQWDGGKVVGLKRAGSTDVNPRLWPLNIKHLFGPGALKWVVFVQDERAAVSLKGWHVPVVCSSGGVENLPGDLSWLGQYDRVIVVLSNDEGGWWAMLGLANAILQQCPNTQVSLHRWPADTPSGFGVAEFCEISTLEDFKRQILERAAAYRTPASGDSHLRFASGPDRKRKSEEKVESVLRSAGGEMDRTTLMRKTRLPKHDLDEALASLGENNLVSVTSKSQERPQGGGRPIVVVSWVEK